MDWLQLTFYLYPHRYGIHCSATLFLLKECMKELKSVRITVCFRMVLMRYIQSAKTCVSKPVFFLQSRTFFSTYGLAKGKIAHFSFYFFFFFRFFLFLIGEDQLTVFNGETTSSSCCTSVCLLDADDGRESSYMNGVSHSWRKYGTGSSDKSFRLWWKFSSNRRPLKYTYRDYLGN